MKVNTYCPRCCRPLQGQIDSPNEKDGRALVRCPLCRGLIGLENGKSNHYLTIYMLLEHFDTEPNDMKITLPIFGKKKETVQPQSLVNVYNKMADIRNNKSEIKYPKPLLDRIVMESRRVAYWNGYKTPHFLMLHEDQKPRLSNELGLDERTDLNGVRKLYNMHLIWTRNMEYDDVKFAYLPMMPK